MAIEALSNIVRNNIGAFLSSSGDSSTWSNTDVILSTVAKRSGKFIITDASVNVNDKIDIVQLPPPYTGKGTRADEFELMGPINFTAVPDAGQIIVYWTSPFLQKGYCRVSYKVTAGATSSILPVVYAHAKSANAGDPGIYPEVTLTNIDTGDLIIAYAAKYSIQNGEAGMVVKDSDDGSYTDGQTFTKVMTTSHDMGNSFFYNAFTSVSNRTSSSRKIRFEQDGFSSLIVVVIRNYNQITMFDNPSGYSQMTSSTSGVKTIDNPSTTVNNGLIIGFFGWYNSETVVSISTDWPVIEGFNDGNGQIGQMIVVGKQVVLTGNYDPYITSPDNMNICGISFMIKGG